MEEVYVLLSATNSCIEHWLLTENVQRIEIMRIDPTDPEEEQPGLHDTHVKMRIYREEI